MSGATAVVGRYGGSGLGSRVISTPYTQGAREWMVGPARAGWRCGRGDSEGETRKSNHGPCERLKAGEKKINNPKHIKS